MVDISTAKQQLQEARQAVQTQREAAQEAEKRIEKERQKLPEVTSQRYLRGQKGLTGLQGREQRRQVLGIQESMKTKLSDIEKYKQQLQEFETQELGTYEEQIKQAEAQQKAIEHEQWAYEQAKAQFQSGVEVPLNYIDDDRIRYYYGQMLEQQNLAQETLLSETSKLQSQAPDLKFTPDLQNLTIGVTTPSGQYFSNISDYNKSIVRGDINQSKLQPLMSVLETPALEQVPITSYSIFQPVSASQFESNISIQKKSVLDKVEDVLAKREEVSPKETYIPGLGFASTSAGVPEVSKSSLTFRVPTLEEQKKIDIAKEKGSFWTIPPEKIIEIKRKYSELTKDFEKLTPEQLQARAPELEKLGASIVSYTTKEGDIFYSLESPKVGVGYGKKRYYSIEELDTKTKAGLYQSVYGKLFEEKVREGFSALGLKKGITQYTTKPSEIEIRTPSKGTIVLDIDTGKKIYETKQTIQVPSKTYNILSAEQLAKASRVGFEIFSFLPTAAAKLGEEMYRERSFARGGRAYVKDYPFEALLVVSGGTFQGVKGLKALAKEEVIRFKGGWTGEPQQQFVIEKVSIPTTRVVGEGTPVVVGNVRAEFVREPLVEVRQSKFQKLLGLGTKERIVSSPKEFIYESPFGFAYLEGGEGASFLIEKYATRKGGAKGISKFEIQTQGKSEEFTAKELLEKGGLPEFYAKTLKGETQKSFGGTKDVLLFSPEEKFIGGQTLVLDVAQIGKKPITLYDVLVKADKLVEGRGIKVFKFDAISKAITSQYPKAAGKLPYIKGTFTQLPDVKVPEGVLQDIKKFYGLEEDLSKGINIISPAVIKKTPLSKTFQEQIQKAEQIIKDVLPKTKPPIIQKTITGTSSVKSSDILPLVSASSYQEPVTQSTIYSGTGKYERTRGGILPVQITGVIREEPDLIDTRELSAFIQEPRITQDPMILIQSEGKLKLKEELALLTKPKEEVETRVFTKLKEETKLKEASIPLVSSKERLLQLMKQPQQQRQRQQTRIIVPKKQKLKKPIVTIPKIKIPIGKKTAKQKLIKEISEIGEFEAFGKVKGEDISLGEFSTQVRAEKKLREFLKTKLAASGKITKEGKPLKFGELELFEISEFRPAKRDITRVVQKREFRLGTRPERVSIQRERKKGKFKWL